MAVATDLPREARAFLDALAVGESGGDDDPYHVLYGFGHFDETTPLMPGYYGFPEWPGKDNSRAAGRYQFEPATWRATAASFDGETPDFRLPVWQDRAAWALAQGDYHARTGRGLFADLALRPLHVFFSLHATWPSLNDQFPARYAAALAAQSEQIAPPPTDILALINSFEAAVRALQTNLKGIGLYSGAVDGDWGPLSQAALAAYYGRQA